ncbi:UNVERIFIED_CONTAM: hypothetical protein HDU68_012703 [Siphonaria sp. JEL0065]|nr:hypothetical protein HDU68_012703 [Siphonaria sp. JEL0065]
MNCICSISGGFLSPGLDLKALMIKAVNGSPLDSSAAADLLNLIQSVSILKASSVLHPSLATHCHIISFNSAGTARHNIVLEISLPCAENSLLWMPWLPHQQKPIRAPGNYQHANFGKIVLMPRKTKCYDSAYVFSAQTHPVEPITPPEIAALYSETNEIFGYTNATQGPNMCLENHYDCGRNYISEHADIEKQFGTLHDVYCWVTGPASRTAVFRVRKNGKNGVPAALKKYCVDALKPTETRDLFSVCIPEGLYVMRGPTFQKNYSHEFPQVHELLFKKICKVAPGLWYEFPVVVAETNLGASQTSLVQAEWIKENRVLVCSAIAEGKMAGRKSKKVGPSIQATLIAFDEWCLERTSYTLRQFSAPLIGVAGVLKRKGSDENTDLNQKKK